MAGTVRVTARVRRRDQGRPARGARAVELLVLGVLIAAVAAGVLWVRAQRLSVTVPVSAVTGGAPGGSPAELTAAAADLLEETTAKGGSGYRFEIVQRSTLVARPDGPTIPIPDPVDPHGKPIGETDRYYLNGLTETGYVLPSGFSMEMRSGPLAVDAPVELEKGELLFRALVRDGATYRDDGLGWYATDGPPGIGLDPATAALLPRLLRESRNVRDVDLAGAEGELGKADPAAARAITAGADIADIPGVLAVDAASFTELRGPVSLTFDAAGRLSGILVTARNTRQDTWDLMVVTEITLHYDDVPVGLPDANPLWDGVLPGPADQ